MGDNFECSLLCLSLSRLFKMSSDDGAAKISSGVSNTQSRRCSSSSLARLLWTAGVFGWGCGIVGANAPSSDPLGEMASNGLNKSCSNCFNPFCFGLKEGEFEFYNHQGKIVKEGTYVNDVMNGEWSYFNDGENLKAKFYCQTGTDFTPTLIITNNKDTLVKNGTGKFSFDTQKDLPHVLGADVWNVALPVTMPSS